jgi:hypothetical protein
MCFEVHSTTFIVCSLNDPRFAENLPELRYDNSKAAITHHHAHR